MKIIKNRVFKLRLSENDFERLNKFKAETKVSSSEIIRRLLNVSFANDLVKSKKNNFK